MVIILMLILCNGIFSMSEIALVSARKSKLASESKRGRRGARAALSLAAQPDMFLSTIQIGITLIGILTGLYSGAAFADAFGDKLVEWGVSVAYAHKIAQVAIVAVVTYLSIVAGELVPKRIGLAMADRIACVVAPAMRLLSIAVMPVVWLLSVSTNLIVKVLGLKNKEPKVTEDEIRSLIREGFNSGEVKEVEQDIMERALVLGDLTVSRIMTNRADIVTMRCGMLATQIREIIRQDLHAAYPVYCSKGKEVEGLVLLKDMIPYLCTDEIDVKALMKPALFFPESMTVYDALETLRTRGEHCGLVFDEFGELQGIVTPSDILDSLVGAIRVRNDDPRIDKIAGDSARFLVDGQYLWYDFLTAVDCEDLYKPSGYSTVAGWILERLRHVPSVGETVDWEGLEFKILEMEGARIDKILVTVQHLQNSRGMA